MSRRAALAIAFIVRSAFAEQDRAMARLVDIDGGMDAPQRTVVLEGVDGHRRRVRDLFAEQAKDLFADEFGGEEALVAIGQVVRSDTAARRPADGGRPPQ